MKCSNCFHEQTNHESSICNGSITCLCEKFIPNELMEFAVKIEKAKSEIKTHYDRCKYILENIPQSRNAGSKSFYKIYNEVWHGIKIRKKLKLDFTPEIWKRMPVSSTVNRAKRFVKQDHDELKTYKKEMIIEQTALYQAIIEMAVER